MNRPLPAKNRATISPLALVDPGARLGAGTIVEAFACVGKAVIGPRSLIRSHSVISSGAKIGKGLKTGPGAQVREGTVLGSHVVVGSHCVVLPGARIADNVTLHSFVLVGEYTRIGKDAWLGPGAVTLNTLHPKAPNCRNKTLGDRKGGPVIGNNARVGGNSVINPYVNIGEGAVVASGSVVTRDVAPGMVAAGCPAREVKKISEVICREHPDERVYVR